MVKAASRNPSHFIEMARSSSYPACSDQSNTLLQAAARALSCAHAFAFLPIGAWAGGKLGPNAKSNHGKQHERVTRLPDSGSQAPSTWPGCTGDVTGLSPVRTADNREASGGAHLCQRRRSPPHPHPERRRRRLHATRPLHGGMPSLGVAWDSSFKGRPLSLFWEGDNAARDPTGRKTRSDIPILCHLQRGRPFSRTEYIRALYTRARAVSPA